MRPILLAGCIAALLMIASTMCRAASNAVDDQPGDLADCRPPGEEPRRAVPPSPEFTRLSEFAVRRLAAADMALKLFVTPDLLARARRDGYVRVRFREERLVALKNGGSRRTTEVLIPLDGRWARERTLFYNDAQYRQWFAVSAAPGSYEAFDGCR